MRTCLSSVAALWVWLPASVAMAETDPLCAPLRSFVESVAIEEVRSFSFHTRWGSNFKDEASPPIYAKRCLHSGYEPASPVCKYLADHGATEFPDNNFKRVVACLSPKTRFAPGVSIHAASVSFVYGNDERGADVQVTLAEDADIGGVVLKVKVEGY